MFLGGDTAWKLGPEARTVARTAKRLGLWLHMGRVNSLRRLRYAASIGCDSVDGTFLTYGPDANLPRLLRFLRRANQPSLFVTAGTTRLDHLQVVRQLDRLPSVAPNPGESRCDTPQTSLTGPTPTGPQ